MERPATLCRLPFGILTQISLYSPLFTVSRMTSRGLWLRPVLVYRQTQVERPDVSTLGAYQC
jgi:hypothetical protein